MYRVSTAGGEGEGVVYIVVDTEVGIGEASAGSVPIEARVEGEPCTLHRLYILTECLNARGRGRGGF
jgi:hypothetical protein